jgi:hypothetical protein
VLAAFVRQWELRILSNKPPGKIFRPPPFMQRRLDLFIHGIMLIHIFCGLQGSIEKEQIFLVKGHVKLGIMPCVSPGKTLQKGNHKNDSWFMHGK